MPVVIRRATEAGQLTIKRLVKEAHINPRNLNWQRFLVAEDDGAITGIGQIKPYKDGSRELASIAVVPQRQGQGIGSSIIRALLEGERGTLYLMCVSDNENYYARFGFMRVGSPSLPKSMRSQYRVGKLITTVVARLLRQKMRLSAMKRDTQP